jgi:hypothetical protein
LGASHTYLVAKGKDSETMAKEVVALFKDSRNPDITIECSGAESSVAMGIYATKSGIFLGWRSWPAFTPPVFFDLGFIGICDTI